MSIEQMILGVALVIAAAVVVLLVFAYRQSIQNRNMRTHMAEAQASCQRLETRIETVSSRCESDFGRVRCRLDRLEAGS